MYILKLIFEQIYATVFSRVINTKFGQIPDDSFLENGEYYQVLKNLRYLPHGAPGDLTHNLVRDAVLLFKRGGPVIICYRHIDFTSTPQSLVEHRWYRIERDKSNETLFAEIPEAQYERAKFFLNQGELPSL